MDYSANIKCRQDAETVAELAGNQPQRFWEVLKGICDGKLPKPTPAPERWPPLSQAEALRFEATPMPYGKYQGQPVGEIPTDYLLFLTEGDEFSQRLKRYVKSPRFAARED